MPRDAGDGAGRAEDRRRRVKRAAIIELVLCVLLVVIAIVLGWIAGWYFIAMRDLSCSTEGLTWMDVLHWHTPPPPAPWPGPRLEGDTWVRGPFGA